eukprot:TRINITY_DN31046_c0_g1_i1.p1 TRINITY_DN31046_c0_g1~~TRINITY_DN31046_c0_g1_i1.p1  ORF type:complete len:256 (-),score=77.39 TRINITY_DN31046_c0_g1_i1:40-786(-)
MSSKVSQVPQPESLKKADLAKLDYKAFRKAVIVKRKARRQFLAVESAKRSVALHRQEKQAEKEISELRTKAEKAGDYFLEPEPRVAFVVRIYGIRKIAPKQRKTLQLLRLRQIFNGVFVKVTPQVNKMLELVAPYITWGYPSKELVRKLLLKRGYFRPRTNRRLRIRLQSNEQIFARFPKKTNILCFEDLVNEIFTAGKNFKEAANALWHFKLRPPTGGLKKKRSHFVLGGDSGNREHFIDDLVKRML